MSRNATWTIGRRKGCGIQDQDEDLDGVPNELDECPETPLNEVVDEKAAL